MKKTLVIYGASGHGKVLADIAEKMNQWEQIVFIDDNDELESCSGYEVVGTSKIVSNWVDKADFTVGIGDNSVRKRIQTTLVESGANLAILIHPNAAIGKDVSIGEGSVVMAGAVLNCEVELGSGCIVNTSATIDHESFIDDYVHLSPGVNLGGQVSIGSATWIGIGSSVINNVRIGSEITLGAGAVAIDQLLEKGTYVGVPARRILCEE